MLGAAVIPAAAQESAPAPRTDAPPVERTWELGYHFGVARNSLDGPFLGITPDRDHLLVGMTLTRVLAERGRWTVSFQPGLTPLIVVTNNPKFREMERRGRMRRVEDGKGPVAGFAVMPFGFQVQMRSRPRFQPYVAAAVGTAWFTREMPVAGARRFNFALEMGGGVQWRYSERHSIRFGYKFHHLSNAYTAVKNPGLDGAVFLIGYEHVFTRRPSIR